MKRVKITNGLYGYRPEGAKHPRPVPADGLCIVTDAEAARLAALGVGIVLDPEQLKELTNAKLKELAEEMGIDTAKLKTKAQLIAAITDVPLENAISGEEDDEGAPAGLGAEGPVE